MVFIQDKMYCKSESQKFIIKVVNYFLPLA